MADINISVSITASKAAVASGGTVAGSASKSGLTVAMTGNRIADVYQIISNSEETLLKGDVGTMGYVYLENLDNAITITIRSVTATAGSNFCILAPGQCALFPSGQTALYAIAASGTTAVLHALICEA